jgi:hypothetical protein
MVVFLLCLTQLIMFGCHLTGHDIETVSQMLDDWLNSPSELFTDKYNWNIEKTKTWTTKH